MIGSCKSAKDILKNVRFEKGKFDWKADADKNVSKAWNNGECVISEFLCNSV